MALKNFIKDNFVLVMGLTLPVLLVVLFFLASVLPKSMAAPPQYEMLFTTARYDYQNPPPYNVDFFVRDGILKARVSKNDKQQVNYQNRKLMLYNGKTQTVREVPYNAATIGDVPDASRPDKNSGADPAPDGTEIVLQEFQNMKLDSNNQAPDGYAFDNAGYGHHGLMNEMWGGGRRNTARVVKGAVAFKIPNSSGYGHYYYYDVQFLGWVLQK